jgi:hypothetical protein
MPYSLSDNSGKWVNGNDRSMGRCYLANAEKQPKQAEQHNRNTDKSYIE